VSYGCGGDAGGRPAHGTIALQSLDRRCAQNGLRIYDISGTPVTRPWIFVAGQDLRPEQSEWGGPPIVSGVSTELGFSNHAERSIFSDVFGFYDHQASAPAGIH
jgi:hypothetical protein